MARLYTDEFLETLRSRVDLVQLVSQYVPLKQKKPAVLGLLPVS